MPPTDPFFAYRFLLLLTAAMVFLLVIAGAVACMAWFWDNAGMGFARRRRSKAMARFVERVASGELDDAEREANEIFRAAGPGRRDWHRSHTSGGA